MSLFGFFTAKEARGFARELAAFIASELQGAQGKRDAKFTARAEKVLVQAARRMQDFKKDHALNFWAKSRMANEFLWGLKDGGCPPDYADELTEWFTLRL